MMKENKLCAAVDAIFAGLHVKPMEIFRLRNEHDVTRYEYFRINYDGELEYYSTPKLFEGKKNMWLTSRDITVADLISHRYVISERVDELPLRVGDIVYVLTRRNYVHIGPNYDKDRTLRGKIYRGVVSDLYDVTLLDEEGYGTFEVEMTTHPEVGHSCGYISAAECQKEMEDFHPDLWLGMWIYRSQAEAAAQLARDEVRHKIFSHCRILDIMSENDLNKIYRTMIKYELRDEKEEETPR